MVLLLSPRYTFPHHVSSRSLAMLSVIPLSQASSLMCTGSAGDRTPERRLLLTFVVHSESLLTELRQTNITMIRNLECGVYEGIRRLTNPYESLLFFELLPNVRFQSRESGGQSFQAFSG
jgi:hypothetical protein